MLSVDGEFILGTKGVSARLASSRRAPLAALGEPTNDADTHRSAAGLDRSRTTGRDHRQNLLALEGDRKREEGQGYCSSVGGVPARHQITSDRIYDYDARAGSATNRGGSAVNHDEQGPAIGSNSSSSSSSNSSRQSASVWQLVFLLCPREREGGVHGAAGQDGQAGLAARHHLRLPAGRAVVHREPGHGSRPSGRAVRHLWSVSGRVRCAGPHDRPRLFGRGSGGEAGGVLPPCVPLPRSCSTHGVGLRAGNSSDGGGRQDELRSLGCLRGHQPRIGGDVAALGVNSTTCGLGGTSAVKGGRCGVGERGKALLFFVSAMDSAKACVHRVGERWLELFSQ